ncbi:AraC family transcriptional regulator [Sphingobium sp.]|uniref:AraC family transcriptional regulator n=1 Tax=Sphingobium sp. TaxID=1912891 RepID=UPI0028BF0C37|nr:AraC family transcriptional regulator [Sphingobium sp.]
MADANGSNDEDIISDALGRAPDMQLGGEHGRWRLCRWRQFVGSYTLPALPDPMFVVHIAGKPNVRTWERDGWSEASSLPGCATIVPSGQPTGWLVDGELDVVTLSVASTDLQNAPALDQFKRMRFAFSDPLGVALTRQVLGELYAPQTPERDIYVSALVDALKAHMLRGPVNAGAADIPTSAFSSYRIHNIMNAILHRPEIDHSLEEMAAQAGVTPAHFCRIFKKATGVSPHQYVMRARLDRAQQMLEQSDTPMATIAEALGFTSQSHFTRAFRQFAGETPSDFRRRRLETLQ